MTMRDHDIRKHREISRELTAEGEVLLLGLGGEGTGDAAVQLLNGAVTSSGKLADTWALDTDVVTEQCTPGLFVIRPRLRRLSAQIRRMILPHGRHVQRRIAPTREKDIKPLRPSPMLCCWTW